MSECDPINIIQMYSSKFFISSAEELTRVSADLLLVISSALSGTCHGFGIYVHGLRVSALA